jgi:NADH-quinone oxidoreductase subunit E
MSTGSVPPERLSETMMMDAKLQDIGRDLAAALPSAFGGDAEAVKRNIATSAAMAAFGAGMAGHAFGVWMSAVSNSLEVAQRLTALAAGVAEPAVAADRSAPAASAVAEPVTTAAAPGVPGAPRAVGRPEAPDDLKAIGGIGPKLEKVLNGLGIWTFAQIAALTEGEVLWLDEQLGFRGRITRDEWLKQAVALDAART